MFLNWGYRKLHERVAHEREDELDHARKIIARVLFLGGAPDVGARGALNIGKTVPNMLRNDLAYEMSVIGILRSAINVCEAERDYESRSILTDLLHGTEEDHALWLEQQLRLIESMGLPNYLQSATGDDDGGDA